MLINEIFYFNEIFFSRGNIFLMKYFFLKSGYEKYALSDRLSGLEWK